MQISLGPDRGDVGLRLGPEVLVDRSLRSRPGGAKRANILEGRMKANPFQHIDLRVNDLERAEREVRRWRGRFSTKNLVGAPSFLPDSDLRKHRKN